MANNRLSRILRAAFGKEQSYNKFNDAFFWGLGGGYTNYDTDGQSYLDNGYNVNPVVYSVINQQSTKTASIPYAIHKIEDKEAKGKLNLLRNATKSDLTPQQQIKKAILENKAYSNEDLEMPLETPNPMQTWSEFHSLYKTFLKLTGNVYIYLLCPEDGINKGTPIAVYLLPSHLTQIVLKSDVGLLGVESPIQSYMLIEGNQYIEFEANKVIHIKYPNPNYDQDGSHLYGQSPLKSALRNLQSSNKGLDLNIKTLQSGGAFGLIHGKSIPLQEGQAKEIKERLVEMNNNSEDLAKIAGVSAEVGFTRLSLTSAELQPFEYLKFDTKQICNVLGWSDKLLNSDEGSKYDNVSQFRKQVVTDNIQPDLMLLQDALNTSFLPLFKGYENSELIYDVSELPEMQEDTKQMVDWAVLLLDRGILNRNEVREIVTFARVDDDSMNIYTVSNDVLTLDEAIESSFSIDEPNKDKE
jgi:HK97 family phage portal protein